MADTSYISQKNPIKSFKEVEHSELDIVEKISRLFIVYWHTNLSLFFNLNCCRFAGLFAILMNFGFIYSSFILLRIAIKTNFGDTQFVITFLRGFASLCIWYIVSFKWKAYFKAIHQLKRLNHESVSLKTLTLIYILVIGITILLPIMYAVVEGYAISYNVNLFTDFWLAGLHIEDKSALQEMLLFLVFIVYYAQQFIFPSVLSLVYCLLTWNISKATKSLKIPMKIQKYETLLDIIEQRRKLAEFVKDFETIFRGIMLWLTVYNLASLFAAFLMFVDVSKMKIPIEANEPIHILISSSASFLGTVLCGAMVPESFAVLKKRLRKLRQNILAGNSPMNGMQMKYLMLLESVIDEEELFFTAWGFVNLNKSLILSAMGALITYGVLIVQLKPTSY
ncbi:hypothetical protein CDAR_110111 [Caerostris darwini]|uniref:Gustatory receptor n=1 Tax=Caerostris darwini TaxID=1538125 RepID=A0AAV4W0S5_9ARAC|nr:hypothetical protein CDAR_110111 [Caerostris darwini]